MKPLPLRPARGVPLARFSSRFALLVLVEAALARRFDLIDTETLLVAAAGALAVAAIGIVATLFAFRDVWRDGAPGFAGAFAALIALVLTLAPFAGAGAAAVVYPPIDDVSTNLTDRPVFTDRPPRPPGPGLGLAPVADYARLQAEAYPDILPRRLPLSTVEAHALVRQTAEELGWTLVTDHEPENEEDTGTLEAAARSLVFGLPSDVAIRIVPEAEGARIDVRAASRFPMHDLGANARHIRDFAATLDEVVKRPAGE